MTSNYTVQVALSMLLLLCFALLAVGGESGNEPANIISRHEPPFELCPNVNNNNNNFGHFKSLLKKCMELDKEAEEYPTDLGNCICGIFMDKSNAFYWYLLSDPFIEQAAETIAARWPIPPETETQLFVDNFSALEREKDVINRTRERLEMLRELAITRPTKRLRETWELVKQSNYSIPNQVDDLWAGLSVDHLCGPILNNKLLKSIWDALQKFRQLDIESHFGRSLLNASEKSLKSLLVQREFCEVNFDLKKRIGEYPWDLWGIQEMGAYGWSIIYCPKRPPQFELNTNHN